MNKQNPLQIEQKKAVFISWTLITIILSATIIFPFFVNKESILKYTPTCISKSHLNVECSLCGMTRAFTEICNGNSNKALALNKGSILLFITFTFNSFIYILYVIKKGFKLYLKKTKFNIL